MENEKLNSFKVNIIMGVVLIVFTIVYSLYKIEKLSTILISQLELLEKSKMNIQGIKGSGFKIKEEINDFQVHMYESKHNLNELIQQSYQLNDEINKAFSDTLLDIEGADSIDKLYTKKLLMNEKRIDSVNHKFNLQSDSLISKINHLSEISNKKELENISKTKFLSNIALNLSLILVYLILMIAGIKYALYFLSSKNVK